MNLNLFKVRPLKKIFHRHNRQPTDDDRPMHNTNDATSHDNNTIMMKSVLLLLTFSTITTSALNWQVNSISSCNNAISLSSVALSITCNGSTSCTYGETAIASGSVTADAEFDKDAKVTVQPCIAGVCQDQYSYELGKLCDVLEATDGQECGEAGGYAISYEQEIPDADKFPSGSSTVSSMLTAKIMIGDNDGEECEDGSYASANTSRLASGSIGLGANKRNGGLSAFGMAMIGLAAILAGAAVFAVRKKRQEKKMSAHQEIYGGSFVEMGDKSATMA